MAGTWILEYRALNPDRNAGAADEMPPFDLKLEMVLAADSIRGAREEARRCLRVIEPQTVEVPLLGRVTYPHSARLLYVEELKF